MSDIRYRTLQYRMPQGYDVDVDIVRQDIRYRIHTILYVKPYKTYDIIFFSHTIHRTYKISYLQTCDINIRHSVLGTYNIATYDIVCMTYDVVCQIRCRMFHIRCRKSQIVCYIVCCGQHIVCSCLHIACDIAYDIVYDISIDLIRGS